VRVGRQSGYFGVLARGVGEGGKDVACLHAQVTDPNAIPSRSALGTVTNEFWWPRVIQFGLMLLF
jgi:hypothetical protein